MAQEIWVDNYWYEKLKCAHCSKQTNHRVRGHCFGLEELGNVMVNMLLPLGVSRIESMRLEQDGKFGISCERGKVNIATCRQCGNRRLHIEKNRMWQPAYLWHELETECKACGEKLERNDRETIASCLNPICSARGRHRPYIGPQYRCPTCGDSSVGPLVAVDGEIVPHTLHCRVCGETSTYDVCRVL